MYTHACTNSQTHIKSCIRVVYSMKKEDTSDLRGQSLIALCGGVLYNSKTAHQVCTPSIVVKNPLLKLQDIIPQCSKSFQRVSDPNCSLKIFHALSSCSPPGTYSYKWLVTALFLKSSCWWRLFFSLIYQFHFCLYLQMYFFSPKVWSLCWFLIEQSIHLFFNYFNSICHQIFLYPIHVRILPSVSWINWFMHSFF